MTAPSRPSRSISPYAGAPRLDALLGPAMPGALCSGRAPMFDPPLPGEDDDAIAYRQAAAARLCTDCPARAECAEAAEAIRPAPTGVWGGTIRSGPRPGRPRRLLDRTVT